jgi:hypothetical protein
MRNWNPLGLVSTTVANRRSITLKLLSHYHKAAMPTCESQEHLRLPHPKPQANHKMADNEASQPIHVFIKLNNGESFKQWKTKEISEIIQELKSELGSFAKGGVAIAAGGDILIQPISILQQEHLFSLTTVLKGTLPVTCSLKKKLHLSFSGDLVGYYRRHQWRNQPSSHQKWLQDKNSKSILHPQRYCQITLYHSHPRIWSSQTTLNSQLSTQNKQLSNS